MTQNPRAFMACYRESLWVTVDGIWIGHWIYLTLTECNYKYK
jgi:hypothetical protein